MGKKKFIDKKNSITYQLIARDSSDPYFAQDTPGADRVFVRVDNNPVSDSIFDDAPDDEDYDGGDDVMERQIAVDKAAALPDDVRKEILELGFPDDGYNYLTHLREIKNAGGGSSFHHNPKFRFHDVPHDVKAYDASRLRISEVEGEPEEKSMYTVASRTKTVRVQKAIDPEVAVLLDDSDLSRFGSDVEDLEEDFVVQANLYEGEEEEKVEEAEDKAHISNDVTLLEESAVNESNAQVLQVSAHSEVTGDLGDQPRARRLLDEQFDLLESKEYRTDDDEEDYYKHYHAEDDSLAEMHNLSLNNRVMGGLEFEEKLEEPAADVILRCKEYAEGYEDEDGDKDVVLVEESSDESEVWDCETIVSTYSNLDNHPGRIGAHEGSRKKKLAQTVSAVLSSSSQIISLKGKEKLPIDFLPGSRKPTTENVKGSGTARTEQYKRKKHGQESKEEKKERKSAVKEERHEARRIKKEMKGLYRGEAHRAQRAAAVSGPSSIHLM
ncbi:PREDICTED: protein LTV1 homolog isoform X2 [Lupinus angustifolius]|uniref:protein LTV1 homolog isoform X1 n=1 Tax=Lupinus angustifolius TaxID=3871 RepID=UPI00092ECF4B|nr:PREDICTED: protein LTV1 homolog isoform X1 [Lupinus angustifolius]XP_019449559.1 PREDICTED: protein LTV1 homolog isoform X2 [Lupinus angustifolius]